MAKLFRVARTAVRKLQCAFSDGVGSLVTASSAPDTLIAPGVMPLMVSMGYYHTFGGVLQGYNAEDNVLTCSRTVAEDGEEENTETWENYANRFSRLRATYDESWSTSGMTVAQKQAEQLRAANAAYAYLQQVISTFEAKGDLPFKTPNGVITPIEVSSLAPWNDVIEFPVPCEYFDYELYVLSSKVSATLEAAIGNTHNIRLIGFPGVATGARFKMNLLWTRFDGCVNRDEYEDIELPLIEPSLEIWTLPATAWENQWPEASTKLTLHASYPLATPTLETYGSTGTIEDLKEMRFQLKTGETFQEEVDFTVPPSKVIAPIIRVSHGRFSGLLAQAPVVRGPVSDDITDTIENILTINPDAQLTLRATDIGK